jgi:serine O-acetyltransferase
MDETIKSDLYRYDQLTGIKGLFKGLLTPGFRYMFFHRKAAQCRKKSISWLFYSLIKHHYSYKFGFQIPSCTTIGPGFYIGHFGTIVINGEAVIGKNCNIGHSVTIGQANRGKNKGCPVIGDKVWIGTGSVIVGNIRIGSNVLIAPNSFVNIDIPENSIALGNPVKIIPKDNPTADYINNVV